MHASVLWLDDGDGGDGGGGGEGAGRVRRDGRGAPVSRRPRPPRRPRLRRPSEMPAPRGARAQRRHREDPSAASEGAAKVAAAAAEDAARAHRALITYSGEMMDLPSAPSAPSAPTHVAPTWRWNHAASVVDVDAADRATSAVADYLSAALRGCALDAGPCGEAEPTREGDYGDLLRMARSVLLRPALSGGGGEWGGGVDSDGGVDERGTDVGASDGDEETRDGDDETMWDGYPTGGTDAAGSRAALAHSVGVVWSEAVVSGPPEVRGACVGLLAAVLPRVAATTRGDGPGVCASVGADVAAGWLRPYARLLWELKHGDPGTTSRALRTPRGRRAVLGEGGDSEARVRWRRRWRRSRPNSRLARGFRRRHRRTRRHRGDGASPAPSPSSRLPASTSPSRSSASCRGCRRPR